ncbi:helix-turn-helix domain-containing protein [Pseudonocardia kujensis]|uniref:PucR family transcriptional regulator n=1 Tax=Pseudonocardia kujensis TaxID=1128675 RepID=UPI001E45FBA1|nr:helix-turn-helix domain-containing protein [Pseudonocardia kujensis]MCE0767746.1 helix-turn-helix domain-containing protein [Pseudonocardia kujensis]
MTDSGELRRENHALRGLVSAYRHVSSLAVQDAGMETVAEVIAERVDANVAVVDEKLSVLAAAPADGAAWVAGVIGDHSAHPRLTQVVGVAARTRRAVRLPRVSDAAPLIVAPIVVGDDVPAYLLTLHDGGDDAGEDLRLLLTEHAATICGVILGRERVVAAAATQVRNDLMEGLLSGNGSDPEEVQRWARHLGYHEDTPHRVLSIVLDIDDNELTGRICVAMERFVTTRVPEAITAVRGREVAVVVPEPDPAVRRAEQLAHTCVEHAPHLLGNAVATVGIGDACHSATGIARSYDGARRALDITQRMGRTGTAVAFEDLGIHRLLLEVADPAELRDFVREVFGDLDTPGRGNMAEYLATLSCYFRANNSPQRASQILHVHPNTVSYRIHRVQEMTGLDLGSYRDRLLAQVALEILDAVAGPAEAS